MCIIVTSSHLCEWNRCDWPRSSALWTTMKILTVCIKKNKKESWFLRIPTPPSPLSKPLRVTKEHLRLLPSLMYLSHLKAQYWFWVTLILSPDSLSCALGTERAREENNKTRKTLRGRGGALGGRGRHLAPGHRGPRPERTADSYFLLRLAANQFPAEFQSPSRSFHRFLALFPQILHTSLNCTHANTYTHIFPAHNTHLHTDNTHTYFRPKQTKQ